MNAITGDEFNTFKNIPIDKKVESMDLYLIGINGYKYNMQEVGDCVFGNENYSFTVSLIHRCYNFSGQNSGKYGEGCKFEQSYGYRVTRKDIEAFVKKYPYGTFNNGITFENFLLTRISNNDFAEKKPAKPKNQNMATRSHPISTKQKSPQYNRQTNYNMQTEDKSPISGGKRLYFLGMAVLGGLALIKLLIKGILFKYWPISLLLLFHTLAMIVGLGGELEDIEEEEGAEYVYKGLLIICAVVLIIMLCMGNLLKYWEISAIMLIYALRNLLNLMRGKIN